MTDTTPSYVVKRSGNDYKIVRTDGKPGVHNSLCVAGGTLLVLSALRRGGILGLTKGLTGAGILYHGITGKNPLNELRAYFAGGCSNPADKLQDQAGPSHQHDIKSPSVQTPQDEIDESSMESFPASDPPAHSRSTSTETVGA